MIFFRYFVSTFVLVHPPLMLTWLMNRHRFGRKLVPRMDLSSPREKARAKAFGHPSGVGEEGGEGAEGWVEGDGDGDGGGEGSKGKKRTNR